MFTGLIEETGVVQAVDARGKARRFIISADKIFDDLSIDDSIAVNGVCLTVVAISANTFEADAVDETLRKSTLGSFSRARVVNLERCLRPVDRLGGHIVQGHVDCVGRIVTTRKQAAGCLLQIDIPKPRLKYIIEEGSISIDGVSLTVARKSDNKITIALIPHTLEKTNLGLLRAGDKVNIEVDVLGKYVESLMRMSETEPLPQISISDPGFEMQ